MAGSPSEVRQRKQANGSSNGQVSNSNGRFVPTEAGRKKDIEGDTHHKYEFGGPPGVIGMMVGFPMLMYYLWACLWFYQGKFVHPSSVEDIKPFLRTMAAHVREDAYPTAWAVKSYLGLMAFQLILAFIVPGKKQNGLPVASLNYKTLVYHCNAIGCWYITLVTAGIVHYFDIFDLTTVIDNFGPLMTVAMIVGFALTTAVYFGSVFLGWGGQPIRMSGNFFYDYFMGAALNPRIGSVDLKMWQEVRIPWVLLFLIALSATLEQYREIGYVTANMAFMLLATALYINACAKGEEMIPTTMDMIHEKDGFMLTFWNFAGVYVLVERS
ncbi:C-24 reductase [Phaffia rhodozyma]|uniref:Delta(24(24(1)))-sterol reductase n=1 Tax=Phaffia rhodozyma TaxID=264483 RepID=A0A0F7ST06_PHARH|nr:C-24 reductase [Phaffia rhodozyma]